MAEPFIGEIIAFCGTFAPQGYQLCGGQLVSIAEYDALYNLIGTTYGGDGETTFGLPNLFGRVPLHTGQGPSLPNFVMGQMAGAENVTINSQTMPGHNHIAQVSQTADTAIPGSNLYLANEVTNPPQAAFAYGPPTNNNTVQLAPNSVSLTGFGLAHENRQPFLAIIYCIAMYGVYPTQN